MCGSRNIPAPGVPFRILIGCGGGGGGEMSEVQTFKGKLMNGLIGNFQRGEGGTKPEYSVRVRYF